jgi:hypothetical protein
MSTTIQSSVSDVDPVRLTKVLPGFGDTISVTVGAVNTPVPLADFQAAWRLVRSVRIEVKAEGGDAS